MLQAPLTVVGEGYLWGAPSQHLTKHLSNASGFDVIILADLLFNHSEHAKLIKSVQLMLKKSATSKAYVFFTPYRPWLLQKDLDFFPLAEQSGFTVTKTLETVMDKVMFEEDPGVTDPRLRPFLQFTDVCQRTRPCDEPSTVTSSHGLA